LIFFLKTIMFTLFVVQFIWNQNCKRSQNFVNKNGQKLKLKCNRSQNFIFQEWEPIIFFPEVQNLAKKNKISRYLTPKIKNKPTIYISRTSRNLLPSSKILPGTSKIHFTAICSRENQNQSILNLKNAKANLSVKYKRNIFELFFLN
jgi:hypothetical protein